MKSEFEAEFKVSTHNQVAYLEIRQKWIKIVHFDLLKKNTLYNQKKQKESFKEL